MTAAGFPGFRFDGRTALAQEVVVTLDGRTLAVTARGGIALERVPLDPARVSERFAAAPRVIALNRGVMLHNMMNNPFLGAPAGSLPAVQYAIASKVTSTQTAFDVASDALQIFGGNGLSYEYPIEKVMRDARASMIEDGTNEVLSLFAADKL